MIAALMITLGLISPPNSLFMISEGIDIMRSESDLEQIYVICTQHAKYLLPVNAENPIQKLRELLSNPGFKTFVYRHQGSIIGFITFSKVERSLFSLLFFSNKGFIWLVGMDKEYLKHGYSRYLFDATFNSLREEGVNHVELYVLSTNSEARQVYEHYGFYNNSEYDDFDNLVPLTYRKDL